MANPSFISGTQNSNTFISGTSVTVSSNGSVASGNLMIVVLQVDGTSGVPSGLTPPAGWSTLVPTTLVRADQITAAAIFYKTSAGGNFSGNFSWTTTANIGSWVFSEWTGQAASPFDGAAQVASNAASSTPTTPGITPSAANTSDTLVGVRLPGNASGAVLTIPAGMATVAVRHCRPAIRVA